METKRRIIHIEDDLTVQEVMQCLIEQFFPDIELISRDSAQSGIGVYTNALRQGKKFDLIIIDGMLHAVWGWTVIEMLRTFDPALPPVLAYVGDLDGFHQAMWNRVGVTELIKKPADLDALVATITRLLAQGGTP